MNVKKIIAFTLIAVAGADLFSGNTDHPILPDALGNALTQQIDLILLGVGGILLFVKF